MKIQHIKILIKCSLEIIQNVTLKRKKLSSGLLPSRFCSLHLRKLRDGGGNVFMILYLWFYLFITIVMLLSIIMRVLH